MIRRTSYAFAFYFGVLVVAAFAALGFLLPGSRALAATVGDRAFEQVSPVDKGGADAIAAAEGLYKITVSEDGDAVGLCSSMTIGAQMGTECGAYLIKREESGWRIRPTLPRLCGTDLEGTELPTGAQPGVWYAPKFDKAALQIPETGSCPFGTIDPLAPKPAKNLYLANPLGAAAAFTLLAPQAAFSQLGFTTGPELRGGDDDFSHFVYRSTGRQDLNYAASSVQKLFEWDEGTVRQVTVNPAGASFATASEMAGISSTAGTSLQVYGHRAISTDGERIYFQNGVPTGNVKDPTTTGTAAATVGLYLREDGTITYNVGESEFCPPPKTAGECGITFAGEVFQWGSEDGSKALFFSKEKLVSADDAVTTGNDLYEYRHSASPATDSNLTLLTLDKEPADGTVASYQGTLGMSDDGNVVYFVAKGQIVAGGPTVVGPKVYRWDWNGGTPQIQYLATLTQVGSGSGADDTPNWHYSGINPRTTVRRVNPSGAYLLLETITPLDAVNDQDADRDVYRWSQAGGWLCISCQASGAPSAGESSIHGSAAAPLTVGSPDEVEQNARRQDAEPLTISTDDGEQIFFASSDQLDPADTNSVQDAYEWHNGAVQLVSSGTGTEKATLIGSSRDGGDVFFFTAQSLVDRDIDKLVDIYDARVGGGFDESTPPPPICLTSPSPEACQGPPAPPPPPTTPQSPSLRGSGNGTYKEPVRCRKGFKKVKVNGKAVCKKVKKNRGGKSTRKGR